MTFEKARFFILTEQKITDEKTGDVTYEHAIKEVEGYLFQTQLPESMELVTIGVYKRAACNKTVKGMAAWVVTDLDTGYQICEGDTRKKAVETFLKWYATKYDRLRRSNDGRDYRKMVEKFDSMIEGC